MPNSLLLVLLLSSLIFTSAHKSPQLPQPPKQVAPPQSPAKPLAPSQPLPSPASTRQSHSSPPTPQQPKSPQPSQQPKSPPPPQQPSSPPPTPQEQLKNIVDALIGATDFASWANILSLLDTSILPFSVTGFVPDEQEFSNIYTAEFDPSLVPYHIIPQRLSFSDLTLFRTNSRLPTLLLNRSILITNNSHENFTLDDTRITYPDLYTSDTLALHGIDGILDYHVYGYPLNRENNSKGFPPPPPPSAPLSLPPVAGVGWVKSKGSCLVTRLITPVVLLFCVLSLMGS